MAEKTIFQTVAEVTVSTSHKVEEIDKKLVAAGVMSAKTTKAVEGLVDDIKDLGVKQGNLADTTDLVISAVDDLVLQTSGIKGQIDTTNGLVDDLKKSVDQAEENVKVQLYTIKDQLHTHHQSYEEKFDVFGNQIKSFEDGLDRLNYSVEIGVIHGLLTKISAHLDNISTEIDNRNRSHETILSSLESKVLGLSDVVSTYDKALDDVSNEIADFSQQVAVFDKQVSEVRIATIKNETDDLTQWFMELAEKEDGGSDTKTPTTDDDTSVEELVSDKPVATEEPTEQVTSNESDAVNDVTVEPEKSVTESTTDKKSKKKFLFWG